ncbi:MAG: hypothetical protein J2P25_11340 [Nocardiopsaceae bacterium]|nr:hypothetical protein [Nocardiopsaceae bacterium]
MHTRKRHVSARPEFSRRTLIAGGIGAGALIALPQLASKAVAAADGATGGATGSGATRYAFIYGTTGTAPSPGGSLATSGTLAPSARKPSGPTALPAAVPVASRVATPPVVSPDQATAALVTIDDIGGGRRVTLALVDMATLKTVRQNSITVTGIPDGTNILATPVFAPGTSVVPVVLAITVPKPAGQMRKFDAATGAMRTHPATSYVSQHALAYFDTSSGAFTGPHYLRDEGTLALTTVAANGTDLFVITTQESRAAARRPVKPPVSQLHAYPLGEAKARFSTPAFGPWPGGEPVVTLPSGDIARMLSGRAVQVFNAKNGDTAQHAIAPIDVTRAKPSAITMQARHDGTVFITKPGIGKAVIADPARDFRIMHEITYPVPAKPLGAPWSKAVLSGDASTLYVTGSATAGGLAAYDVKTGDLTGAYSHGHVYAGVFAMPSGSLLAVSAANPRLTYFSPELSPLAVASTDLHVANVY